MVLELNVARVEGRLAGGTAEERFRHFANSMREPSKALAVLADYPVLCRQLVIAVDQWLSAGLETLERLILDQTSLQETFGNGISINSLLRVDTGKGDFHKGGRSVSVLHFSSGEMLVYKPRSMAIDAHFQDLLRWVNANEDGINFRTIPVLDMGSHGWTEFVHYKSCESSQEVRRFYERQGGYLALLHCLGATDMHFENLIANGEHPVLIDLESLFHPKLAVSEALPGVDGRAHQFLYESVLRVGLLPQRVWGESPGSGIDLSGLGAEGGQELPFDAPIWEGVNTDEMHLAYGKMRLPSNNNRPLIDGEPVDTTAYSHAIIAGFKLIYGLLRRSSRWLSKDRNSVLNSFALDEIRFIPRPTRFYSQLLTDSFHPDYLQDAESREKLYDNLTSARFGQEHLEQLHAYERDDLWENDIPYFSFQPSKTSLISSRGNTISSYFQSTSLEEAKRRISALTEEDCAKQCRLIEASMTTLAMGKATWRSYVPSPTAPPVSREQMIAEASRIGDRLVELAIQQDSESTWVGLSMIDEHNWALTPMGLGLYDGVAGIGLYLAYLGSVTGEQRYTRAAEGAVAFLRNQWRDFIRIGDGLEDPPKVRSIGVFESSPTAAIYVLNHLGVLWNDTGLLDEAEALLPAVMAAVETDQALDIIGGSAGAIRALLNLDKTRPSPEALKAAQICGDHVLRVTSGPDPKGWQSHDSSTKPLTGFSHGAAGIGWALQLLAFASNDARFKNGAQRAFGYERQCFDRSQSNWPDFRQIPASSGRKPDGPDAPLVYMTTWCHGAPGIGLSRLDLLKMFSDPEIEREVQSAVHTTSINKLGMNHSLCHGDLGNLELIWGAARWFGDESMKRSFDKGLSQVVGSIGTDGWLTGVPLGAETPGLMSGLAGIGYQLLRFAAPHKVPSILLLEGPNRAPAR